MNPFRFGRHMHMFQEEMGDIADPALRPVAKREDSLTTQTCAGYFGRPF
jgi:hypothetical protein